MESMVTGLAILAGIGGIGLASLC
ncbi:protein of unknown function [Brochothrix thermosphacta]|nr:protein of unknown function [Brochothrix thermosphacta]SPN75352.1 hypothetical protein BTEBP_20151 [Brochothrix thermosphacta]